MRNYLIGILIAIAGLWATYAIADAARENWKETRVQNLPV